MTSTNTLDTTIHDLLIRTVSSIASQTGLTLEKSAVESCLDDIDDTSLEDALYQTTLHTVGTSFANAMIATHNIPHVIAHVDFEIYDTAFDTTHIVDEAEFDCTTALEIMTRDLTGDDLDIFLGYNVDDNETYFDLSPEDLDALYRISADIGLVNTWHHSFYCTITDKGDGWDAWAKHRRNRSRQSD